MHQHLWETTGLAFGAGRSIWTALVRRKADRSLLYAEPRCPLNVDDGARSASLAIEHLGARVAATEQDPGSVTLRIAGAGHKYIALEDDRVVVAAARVKSGLKHYSAFRLKSDVET